MKMQTQFSACPRHLTTRTIFLTKLGREFFNLNYVLGDRVSLRKEVRGQGSDNAASDCPRGVELTRT